MKNKLTKEQKIQRASYSREWRKNNKDKVAASSKKARIKNRDKILECQRKWLIKNKEKHIKNSKLWYQNNKDRVRDNQLKRQFGISLEEYNKILDNQSGVCHLCGGGPDVKSKKLAVDHDHETGKIRALLCRGCNVGIGNLKDDFNLLRKAADYIEKFKNCSNK